MSEQKIVINKRLKGLPREQLEKLTKVELIDKIIQLEAYNFQLKNILQKKLDDKDKNDADYVALMQELKNKEIQDTASNTTNVPSKQTGDVTAGGGKQDKKRKFDWSSAHKRHVLLKILYFGWDYQGYACQEDSNETIEYHIFRALTRTCLIESRATSNYHRCGRTDKEVSAYCQVISIDLRSKFPIEAQSDKLDDEIDYCGLLNRVLPKNIQCIAWMPLRSPIYSARFDCVARTYRYYFPCGDLNINAMREACKLLERHADFRNFCKMDVHNGVTNYMRHLQAASIEKCNVSSSSSLQHSSGYEMYYLQIKANAFLWHQIRCIMAILLLIGQQKEQPNVISELLDVVKHPCKPQYTPAIGLPLNLFHCDFRTHTTRLPNYKSEATSQEEDNVAAADVTTESTLVSNTPPDTSNWIYNVDNLQKLIENVQSEWTQFSVKCTMIHNVLEDLESLLRKEFKAENVKGQVLLLQDSVKPRQYQELLQRKRCESLENRIEHFVKKQRLIVQQTE